MLSNNTVFCMRWFFFVLNLDNRLTVEDAVKYFESVGTNEIIVEEN
jgi:hypothetical protein